MGGSCFLVPARAGPGTGEVVSGAARARAGRQEPCSSVGWALPRWGGVGAATGAGMVAGIVAAGGQAGPNNPLSGAA